METTSKQTILRERVLLFATNGSAPDDIVGELSLLTPPSGTPSTKFQQTNENKSVCWFGKQPIGWTQQASKQPTKHSEDVQLLES